MSLKQVIQNDVKAAMRAQDKPRLGVLRLITAALKQREVDERIELDDAAVQSVLNKMVKQRRDSIEQFEAAQRTDLADKERFELEILAAYMPEQLSNDELTALIEQVVTDTGAASVKDMGAVMGRLSQQIQGRADMKAVSQAVRERLAS